MATPDTGAASAASQNDPTHVDGAQGAGRTAPKETHLTEREALFERAIQRREAEYAAAPAEAQAAGDDPPAAAATTAAPAPAAEPSLDDYVVIKDGKPMLKLKVDGRDVFQPLATARATLQKHSAAEKRLAEAAEARRQNDIQAQAIRQREIEIQRREQALTQPAPATTGSQPSAATAAVDDQGLQNEAKELVASLLRDSEDEAAKKVAKVLARVRQAPAAPAVDVNAIAKNVAQTVKGEIRQEAVQRDMVSGYNAFQNDYPEIAGDPNLYRIADGLTNDIAKEHSDWSPSQVMAEAGKQTREWLQSIGAPAPTPAAAPKGTTKQPTDRQTVKQNLRPMPAARTARQPTEPSEQPTRVDPREALMEMRKARGQAV
jgi:hypothetical protein